MWWRHHQLDKAKRWLEASVAVVANNTEEPQMAGSRLGDAWAALYHFAMHERCGLSPAEVQQRCVAANPTRGERWVAVRKARGNEALSTEEVLHRVARSFAYITQAQQT